MATGKNNKWETIFLHAVLLTGCVAFGFPFIWMLMTSFKVPVEMNVERLRLLPTTPVPRDKSPYIAPDEYIFRENPDGIPSEVWKRARPLMLQQLEKRLDVWRPRLQSAQPGETPSIPDTAAYRRAMLEGLLESIQPRLSDRIRQCTLDAARTASAPSGDSHSEKQLLSALPPAAVETGVAAVLSETGRIADDAMLTQVFEGCYRRFCLGELWVRTTDYQLHGIAPSLDWRVERGQAELAPRRDGSAVAQEARMTFAAGNNGIAFVCTPSAMRMDVDAVDRIFVRYRADSSWAKVVIEVARKGKLYRTGDSIALFDREWIEQELRWPGSEGDPTARRTYCMLEPVGDAPAGTPNFMVRLTVTKNNWAGAWVAKLTNNYNKAFREVPFARYIMTSFALVILNILLTVFSCTMVGYAFARLEWPGREFCFGLLLATMMLPGQVTMIPVFLIIKHLGWFNTLLPLWATSAFGAPFFIFLFRQFFKNIPIDLIDAARIDGCGFLRIYWHVMLPLVKPTIATTAIFTFIGSWNNFMGPLIYLNNDYCYPLALGLFKFNLRNGGDICLMMAGSLVMTLPIILLFFFVQRYFIQGISLSGTKA